MWWLKAIIKQVVRKSSKIEEEKTGIIAEYFARRCRCGDGMEWMDATGMKSLVPKRCNVYGGSRILLSRGFCTVTTALLSKRWYQEEEEEEEEEEHVGIATAKEIEPKHVLLTCRASVLFPCTRGESAGKMCFFLHGKKNPCAFASFYAQW
jgi:hypothetical protein